MRNTAVLLLNVFCIRKRSATIVLLREYSTTTPTMKFILVKVWGFGQLYFCVGTAFVILYTRIGSLLRVHSMHSSLTSIKSVDTEVNYFIFGLGYVGSALAKELRKSRICVSGTNRCKMYNGSVTGSHIWNEQTTTTPELSTDVASATHVLCTIPPLTYAPVDTIIDQFSTHLIDSYKQGRLQWVGYLSSTSAYGNKCNGWVTEGYPLQPSSKREWPE